MLEFNFFIIWLVFSILSAPGRFAQNRQSWENSLRKLCYVYVHVHVHVDGDDGMGNKWEDIKERELSSLPNVGDSTIQWERELDRGFLLPNCNFIFF